MEAVEIRTATINDAAAIAELSRQLGYPSSLEETTERLQALVQTGDHAVFVACLGNDFVVGWLHVFRALRVESDPFCELGGFVVAEPQRGEGIGRALLEAVESWSTEHGVLRLRVRTRHEREGAHRFYRHQGFTKTKDQRVYDKRLEPIA
jgi:GNAT superfamily N-acetyltransferase